MGFKEREVKGSKGMVISLSFRETGSRSKGKEINAIGSTLTRSKAKGSKSKGRKKEWPLIQFTQNKIQDSKEREVII